MRTSNRSVCPPCSKRVSATSRTAVYGPVRTVVWEGRGREAPPYPDQSSKSIGKESALQRSKTGKFDYLSEPNHPAHSMAFKFFTDDYLKSEDKPDCRIDCVAIEVAVSQSFIDLREHEPDVSLELRR